MLDGGILSIFHRGQGVPLMLALTALRDVGIVSLNYLYSRPLSPL